MRVVRLCYYLSYLRIYDNNGNGGSIRDVDTVISFPSVYPYRIILFDEFGQASAEQVKTLDILLRKVRNSNIPAKQSD